MVAGECVSQADMHSNTIVRPLMQPAVPTVQTSTTRSPAAYG